jgi:cell fate (sporulation/competence/biofilm development) regulator YlbF (YheA/YmcA/DUF963 family)
MAGIYEMARDLGNALARTDEYQALKRAIEAADEDRELVEVRNRLQAMEQRLEGMLRQGQQPDDDFKETYRAASEKLQTMPAFQQLVAAQSNFEKVMYKVNETVASGIDEGAQSRIIISS